MKKLVSSLALALTTLGLAACGSSNDPATNATIENDAILNEELPADENLTLIDNGAVGNELADNAVGNGL